MDLSPFFTGRYLFSVFAKEEGLQRHIAEIESAIALYKKPFVKKNLATSSGFLCSFQFTVRRSRKLSKLIIFLRLVNSNDFPVDMIKIAKK